MKPAGRSALGAPAEQQLVARSHSLKALSVPCLQLDAKTRVQSASLSARSCGRHSASVAPALSPRTCSNAEASSGSSARGRGGPQRVRWAAARPCTSPLWMQNRLRSLLGRPLDGMHDRSPPPPPPPAAALADPPPSLLPVPAQLRARSLAAPCEHRAAQAGCVGGSTWRRPGALAAAAADRRAWCIAGSGQVRRGWLWCCLRIAGWQQRGSLRNSRRCAQLSSLCRRRGVPVRCLSHRSTPPPATLLRRPLQFPANAEADWQVSDDAMDGFRGRCTVQGE